MTNFFEEGTTMEITKNDVQDIRKSLGLTPLPADPAPTNMLEAEFAEKAAAEGEILKFARRFAKDGETDVQAMARLIIERPDYAQAICDSRDAIAKKYGRL